MKRVFILIILAVIFTAALIAAPPKVWVIAEPGYGDTVGDKLCNQVITAIGETKQFEQVYDDNPDHMFNLVLTTVQPAETDSVTCLNYELFFCVTGYPKLYATSFLDTYGRSQIEEAAYTITKRVLQDIDTFYLGYPAYKPKSK